MGKVRRYRVTVNGTDTVLKLTAEDAKRYEGAELVDATATDTDVSADSGDTEEKAAKPENKARTAQNKGRAGGAAGNR